MLNPSNPKSAAQLLLDATNELQNRQTAQPNRRADVSFREHLPEPRAENSVRSERRDMDVRAVSRMDEMRAADRALERRSDMARSDVSRAEQARSEQSRADQSRADRANERSSEGRNSRTDDADRAINEASDRLSGKKNNAKSAVKADKAADAGKDAAKAAAAASLKAAEATMAISTDDAPEAPVEEISALGVSDDPKAATKALKQDIALAVEAPVLETIAPQKVETASQGMENGKADGKNAKDAAATNPVTAENAGLTEALDALKLAANNGKDEAQSAEEAARAKAKAAIELAVSQAARGQASIKVEGEIEAMKLLSLDGSKGRSIAPQVLSQTLALKESGASQAALAANGAGQAVAADAPIEIDLNLQQNASGDQRGANPAQTGTPAKAEETAVARSLKVDAEVQAQKPDLASLQAEEAKTNGRKPAAPQTQAMPNQSQAAQQSAPQPASQSAQNAPQVMPAELGAAQKVANVQNLTSSVAKPEVANLPQQSSQAVPIQTVGLHIARQALNGQTQFNIRLDPPELGRVEVKLDISDEGKMRAHIIVEKSETLDLLQRDQRALERAMQQNGLKGFEDGLSFSLKDQGNGEGAFAGRDGKGQSGENADAKANEKAEAELAALPPEAYRQVRLGGVDLSV